MAQRDALHSARQDHEARSRLSLAPNVLDQIENAAYAAASEALGFAPDATTVLRAAEVAFVQSDSITEQAASALFGEGFQVACAKGCWYCCTSVVACTLPEVLRIADRIKRTWTTADRAALIGRLDQYIDALAPYRSNAETAMPRRACALLVDGLCSVWPDRPFACRGFNSFDVAPCRARASDPLDQTPIPQMLPQSQIAFHCRQGLMRALSESRLRSEVCDLALALRIALAHPDPAGAYARREPIFEAAIEESRLRDLM